MFARWSGWRATRTEVSGSRPRRPCPALSLGVGGVTILDQSCREFIRITSVRGCSSRRVDQPSRRQPPVAAKRRLWSQFRHADILPGVYAAARTLRALWRANSHSYPGHVPEWVTRAADLVH